MICLSECNGPVLCQADGCWYCPRWQTDDYDCEVCRELEQDAADRANDMAAA